MVDKEEKSKMHCLVDYHLLGSSFAAKINLEISCLQTIISVILIWKYVDLGKDLDQGR